MKESGRNVEVPEKRRGSPLRFGKFCYHPRAGLLYRGRDEVRLPPRAQQVLHLLLERAGSPISKEELLQSIWNDAHVTEASLSEAVARLREALGDDPQSPAFVRTLHRRGYQFIARVSEDPLPRPAGGRSRAAGAGLLLAGALAGWCLASLFRFPAPGPVVRFTVDPPEGEVVFRKGQPALALSRDGGKLVFTSEREGTARLSLRELDRPDSRSLPGTEGAAAPFFSPDAGWVAFFAEGALRKISLHDLTRVEICTAPAPHGGTWLDDGRILFSSEGRLEIVSSDGGTPGKLEPSGRSFEYRWPEALPGRPEVLATLWRGSLQDADVVLLSLEDGVERSLAKGAFAKPIAGERIAYARPGRIVSRSVRETGAGRTLLEGVSTDPFTGAAQFAVGERGLVYLPGSASVSAPNVLRWADAAGFGDELPLEALPIKNARLSPDGRGASLTVVAGSTMDLFLWSSERRGLSRITRDGRSTGSVWTPDGTRIAFARREGDRFQVFWMALDGTGSSELLVGGDFDVFPTSWSRDGRILTLDVRNEDTGWDVFVLRLDDEPALEPIERSRFQERAPRVSPGGEWVAYQSDETGRNEIYLRGLRAPGVKARVSSGGGEWPLWSPGGDELYFTRGRTLLKARVSGREKLELGLPSPVLETGGASFLDVAPDGRLLAIEPEEAGQPLRPHVVLGWEAME